MEGALAWIGQLAEWIGQFFPRIRNIRLTHQAVKFKKGTLTVCKPGMAVYWPLTTDFLDYPTVRQAVELRGQTMVTTDDKTFIAGGLLIYGVDDMAALWTQTWAPEQTIKDIALTVVHDVCCKYSWDALKDAQRRSTLDTKLRNDTRAALASYGVRVEKVMLTDLAPCKVLKLVQTMAKGEE